MTRRERAHEYLKSSLTVAMIEEALKDSTPVAAACATIICDWLCDELDRVEKERIERDEAIWQLLKLWTGRDASQEDTQENCLHFWDHSNPRTCAKCGKTRP